MGSRKRDRALVRKGAETKPPVEPRLDRWKRGLREHPIGATLLSLVFLTATLLPIATGLRTLFFQHPPFYYVKARAHIVYNTPVSLVHLDRPNALRTDHKHQIRTVIHLLPWQHEPLVVHLDDTLVPTNQMLAVFWAQIVIVNTGSSQAGIENVYTAMPINLDLPAAAVVVQTLDLEGVGGLYRTPSSEAAQVEMPYILPPQGELRLFARGVIPVDDQVVQQISSDARFATSPDRVITTVFRHQRDRLGAFSPPILDAKSQLREHYLPFRAGATLVGSPTDLIVDFDLDFPEK